ncbi:Converts 2,5-diamino-6-(ribosylamino)-4(3h)-pyrimidinone 5'-phosphate into 5-amino-6-(ribosylamino)-2,4(1h,3h)-pyrimidinedione 5'-phosphate (By similarity) [Seminavis robusta]|uniref:Converts 2,5-diamino-6-(Ribosylamino)-4(3h)-pyrimidinone 5'-phosphate into 5-amino-6-(Ribosylamino)-2,4(1h,3h)-pyrimidinedione 5'-phosphate By similarity n=1 Tax=Seminavis robusta TaxID=568900 RepID=A0A9N8H7G2_9STRA|nr:Converts 2,5-diamino-6-(ribosylamino)-4(3h)-pyrimidinone 5'-phosphate into 5-amino-6-(ribosylamino)-2,4(1h,3h)-pyrimidinedione 5'-phosphate (By similarity) [Seminavis robusta]|eukprot:Sro178_g078000.1 Converts 2,5-diamino-6-(ribosylamino)-4(3h)-pyrimidinone 5'-phosphate into 5-amino-6-(ribosylamino)-2,4(1h,3h)- pyrimidinedione 5'-phosphate (By similarity) (326) ;mRNA; f:9457-10434
MTRREGILGLALSVVFIVFSSPLCRGFIPRDLSAIVSTKRYRHLPAPLLATLDDHDDASNTVTTSSTSKDRNDVVVTGVTLKVAFDSNWGVAEMADDAPSVRFTCDQSLDMVHRLRGDSDAVLVGRGTVERDDCSLTVRRGVTADKQPLRVILDPRLTLILAEVHEGAQYKVLTDGLPTVIYHCVSDVRLESLNLLDSVTLVYMESNLPNDTQEDLPEGNRPGRYASPGAVVEHLRDNFGVHHLMVEGGPQTAINFLQPENLIDRAILVRAPISFQEPFPSGMSTETLQDAGLELVCSKESGVDTIDYWARPGESWPTDPPEDWP